MYVHPAARCSPTYGPGCSMRRSFTTPPPLFHTHLGSGSNLWSQSRKTRSHHKTPTLRRCVSSLTSPKGRKECELKPVGFIFLSHSICEQYKQTSFPTHFFCSVILRWHKPLCICFVENRMRPQFLLSHSLLHVQHRLTQILQFV